MHDSGEGNPGACGYRGLESGKRRPFPYWGMARGLVDQSNSPKCLAVSLVGGGKGLGDALRDSKLVVEGDDEVLVSLINTQTHKNCDVIGVVREWWASS